jgi:GMP synthase (glutamine-hydrolysing)
MGDFVQLEIARIRDLVGDRALVLGACSGGVDSTVGAAIMREAIGDRFKAVFIDNGCMRFNEREEVKEMLGQHLGINLTVVDAGELFLSRLAGVSDPEKKRKIIGSTCTYFRLSWMGLVTVHAVLTMLKSSIYSRKRLSGYAQPSLAVEVAC